MDRKKHSWKSHGSVSNHLAPPSPRRSLKKTLSLPTSLSHYLDVWALKNECQRKRFPIFKEPRQVGFFSLDDERTFLPDDSQLKFLRLPQDMTDVYFDLNLAYSRAVQKNFLLEEKVDNILHWILHNKGKLLEGNPSPTRWQGLLNADFICFRGLLTVILCTLYEQKDGWIICATKFGGNIYLCAFDTEQDVQRHMEQTDREKLMSSWGYKFEQYMTTDSPHSELEDPFNPVNENHEFCSMVRTRLNEHSLLFGAEMDALQQFLPRDHAQRTGSMNGYVEMKTSRIIDNQRQEKTFHRYKLIKWWAQSFLIGVPIIFCGFRDDNGIVRSVKEFRTQDLPKIAQTGEWSPSVCMNFLDCFLNFVKKCVIKDDYRIVYKFDWSPQQQIHCTELLQPGKFQILPEWYISEMGAAIRAYQH